MVDTSNIRPLSATYSSQVFPIPVGFEGLSILSTLAVFYDEVCFPYPYGFDPEGPVLWQPISGDWLYEYTVGRYIMVRQEWNPIFEHGIFRILPPPISSIEEMPEDLPDVLPRELGYTEDEDVYFKNWDLITGKVAVAIHAVYGQKPSPELFISDPTDTTTSRLAGFVVNSLFRYVVPQLNALHPEQILEVRELVRETKEGFVDYIFEAVDDVEARLISGDASEVEAAQKTVERKLLPKYHEFQRQLQAQRGGFWSEVLVAGSKLLQIDASPWTPKFYGQIIEAFFGPLRKMAEAEAQARSNANQAYQYLATLAAGPPEQIVGGPKTTSYRSPEFTLPS
jgi:hypothetical protein